MARKKTTVAIDEMRFEMQMLAEAVHEMRNLAIATAAASEADQQQQPSTETQPFDLNIEVTEQELADVAALMVALGQPTRLRIAMSLAEQPHSVSELVSLLDLKTTGAAYHHLNVLTQAGVVEQPVRGEFALRDKTRPQINRLMSALFGRGEIPSPEPVAETAMNTQMTEETGEMKPPVRKRKKSKKRRDDKLIDL